MASWKVYYEFELSGVLKRDEKKPVISATTLSYQLSMGITRFSQHGKILELFIQLYRSRREKRMPSYYDVLMRHWIIN